MQDDKTLEFPLISAVIPAYNHEKYIGAAISSLIAQTYPNIELLVMDDGSLDKTWSIIQGMEPSCRQKFSRMSLETQKNQGVSATLDGLIQKAGGEYIYYLGSDDVAEPEAIKTLHAFLSKNSDHVLAVGWATACSSMARIVRWSAWIRSLKMASRLFAPVENFPNWPTPK